MGRRWRWFVAAAGTALLVALPFAAHLLPAGDSRISAAALLGRIKASASVPYSGFAETSGGLALPVSGDVFSSVDDLLSGSSRLRVWWRGTQDWRVDSLSVTGETDTHQDRDGIWTWDYESDTARRTTVSALPQVRLPRTDDLVPAALARRLLSETTAAHVSRLPGKRVAGEQTAGLRLRLDDPRSTLDHVDVWALPSNGLPVRVEVYGRGAQPVLTTSLLDVSLGRPAASTTAFRPASGATLRTGGGGDIVSVTDQLGRNEPPAAVAGFPRRTDLDLGAVGVYGRGITELVALPLSAHLAGEVVPQLRHTPGSVENDSGITAALGTVNLQLSPPAGFGARWLLVGTVTPKALLAAVAILPPAQGFGFGGPPR